MSRHLLVVLLLAAGVGLADKKLEAQQAAGTAEAQRQREAAQERTAEAQTKTETAQGQTEDAPAETEGGQGQAGAQTQTEGEAKLVSVPGGTPLGMSILGNQEAPTSLVIVPWKSSEAGRSPGISPMLDDSKQPVDKEVFLRALRYYEIRSEARP